MSEQQQIELLNFQTNNINNIINSLSNQQIANIHFLILECYENYLKAYEVKPLWNIKNKNIYDKNIEVDELVKLLDAKELQLIFLYHHKDKLVHKDVISAFVRKYKIDAGLDQQIRHLGSQYHWNILNKGNKIPDKNIIVPSGYHYLVSIETPNPKILANALKRTGRIAAKNFDQLKLAYNNTCATCGISEGKKDSRFNDVIVALQQGHMNPRKALDLTNTIPQCQYCNQTYKDYFIFNEFGRVIAINNPEIVLKSPKDVQDEIIKILVEERKRSNK